MMSRLSLQQRVIAAALVVLVLVLGLVNVAVVIALRETRDEDVHGVLAARVALAELLSATVPADELVGELAVRGIAAEVVKRPNGEPVPATSERSAVPEDLVHAVVVLSDGSEIAIYAATAAGDTARERARTLLVGSSVAGVLLAALLLIMASRAALRPLEDVGVAARSVADGQPWTAIEVKSPHTEVGKLTGAIDDMVDVFEHSLEEARLNNARTQRFLGDAAHQLRTPLAGIRASAELLAMGPSEEDAGLLMTNLVADCERLTRLVTALMRMARIDQGEIAAPVPSDLVVICRNELDRVRVRYPEVDLQLDVPDPAPQPIDLDPASMAEALSNLLDNASRHARGCVTLRLLGDGPTLVVRVEDDGPGLDEAGALRAFERFASLDDCGGSGLGLPIARGIFEAHQGTLDYEAGGFVGRLPRERRRTPRVEEAVPLPLVSASEDHSALAR
jgi:signal transduction histidine kinase